MYGLEELFGKISSTFAASCGYSEAFDDARHGVLGHVALIEAACTADILIKNIRYNYNIDIFLYNII